MLRGVSQSMNLWFNRHSGMKIWRLMVIVGLVLLAAACAPAEPTRPPTRTPTRTVARPTELPATPEDTAEAVIVEPGSSETPAATPSARITATVTPMPTTDPLACLPDDPGQTGLVSWVNDGATFVIDLGGRRETVHLLGIDALPLTEDTTRGLIDQRVVRLVPDGPDRDEQGRLLRYVLWLDGRFINDELLRSGAARLGTDVGGLSCMAQFDAAEEFAAQEGLGLWDVEVVAALPTSLLLPSPIPSATNVPLLVSPTLAPTRTPGATVQASPSVTPGGMTATPTITNQTPPAPPPPTITSPPTITRPAPTGTVVGTGVQIVSIFYDGVKGEGEPDEYVEIKNFESTPVDLSYWVVHAVTNDYYYVFSEFTIQPGQSCRIYTNEIHPDTCVEDESFLFPLDTYEVWDNTSDCGELYNYTEEEPVSTKCYGQ